MSTRSRRLTLGILVAGLAGGVAIAHAAPKRGRKGPRAGAKRGARASCPAPTASSCLTKGYLERCAQHRKACAPHIKAGFETHRESSEYKSAPVVPAMKPGMTAIPQGLNSKAKHFAYAPPSKIRVGPNSGNLFAASGLTGPAQAVTIAVAKKAHRSPNWENNADRVATCSEYAYEQMYDWAQFTDATAACRDNWKCQLAIAVDPANPGLANRTLRRKDGRPLADQIEVSSNGTFPKNDLFVFGKPEFVQNMVLAGGPALSKGDPKRYPRTPALDALITTLEAGHTRYNLDCSGKTCGSTGFRDEWAFHDAMSKRLASMSMAEFEEFERRKTEFNRLLSEWGMAVQATKNKVLKASNKPERMIENPLTHVINPVGRDRMLKRFGRTLGRNRKAFQKQVGKVRLNPAGLGAKKIKTLQNSVPQYHSALASPLAPLDETNLALGVLAAPPRVRFPRPKPGTSKPKTKSKTKSKPGPGASKAARVPGSANRASAKKIKTVDECAAWGNTTTDAELLGIGPHSCRIGQFLRREWERKKNGEVSCLDLGNASCDWSPQMFQRRFIEGAPYLAKQAKYEIECNDWLPSITPKKDLKTKKKTYPKLAVLEADIAEIQAQAKQALAKLRPYTGAPVGGKIDSIGRTFREYDGWGDKGWIAGAYEAKFDWRVAVTDRKQGKACELAGRSGGEFTLDGWLLKKKIGLLRGSARARLGEVADTFAVDAGLKILGISVFGESYKGGLVYAPTPKMKSLGRYPSPRPQWTVMAGPVPISGAVWGEAMYGVGFQAKGVLNSPTCDINEIKFGVKTTLSPMFMFSVFGQIGIGITGVASAGVRGMLNLLTISVPLDASLATKIGKTKGGQKRADLNFDVGLSLLLGTLSGKLMLYVEILFVEETWELFRWKGLETKIPLMDPLHVSLPLVAWK